MKKLVQFIFLLTICSKTAVGVPQEAKAYCFKDGTNYRMKFSVVKNDDNVESVYGVSVADETVEKVETCSTASEYPPTEITGAGTTANPYTISVNIAAGVADLDCGHQAVGETYSWLFRTGSAVLLQKPSDKIFSVTCPFGTMSDNLGASASLTVDGDLTNTLVPAVSESIALTLVDETNTLITHAALGAKAKLQLQLQPNSGAKGTYAYSCIAGDSADFTGATYSLIDADGCTETNLLSDGFTGVVSSGSTTRTGVFEVFRFRLSSTVYYRCRIAYCYGDADAQCADFCLYNGKTDVTRRKRRSPNRKPDVIIASYVVTTIPKHVLSTNADKPIQQTRCVAEVGNVVGFCLLGLLVCVSTAAAIFMFYRLKMATAIIEKASI